MGQGAGEIGSRLGAIQRPALYFWDIRILEELDLRLIYGKPAPNTNGSLIRP